jgi:hypothetical protein
MALVKFVEKNRGYAAQIRILDQLAEEDAFGDKADPGPSRSDVLKPDLVTNFVAKAAVAFRRNPRREETRGKPARLKNHDLAVAEKAVIEEYLRDRWEPG